MRGWTGHNEEIAVRDAELPPRFSPVHGPFIEIEVFLQSLVKPRNPTSERRQGRAAQQVGKPNDSASQGHRSLLGVLIVQECNCWNMEEPGDERRGAGARDEDVRATVPEKHRCE